MNQFHTPREQRFIDLAASLADDFAQRAAQHDEEGSFPYENYARLKVQISKIRVPLWKPEKS